MYRTKYGFLALAASSSTVLRASATFLARLGSILGTESGVGRGKGANPAGRLAAAGFLKDANLAAISARLRAISSADWASFQDKKGLEQSELILMT